VSATVTAGWAVVVNGEQQWSVWPADSEPPEGWTRTGFTGEREACLAHISENWHDLRPASLRRRMDGQQSTSDAEGNNRP
jgi:MbtH protein